ALATGIGQTFSLAIYIICYFAGHFPIRLCLTSNIFDIPLTSKIYSIGVPATLNLALPSLLISCLNIILSVYSQIYVLVLGLYYKLQTILDKGIMPSEKVLDFPVDCNTLTGSVNL